MRGITHAARGMGRALGLSPSRVDVWLLETSEPALRDAELLKAYRSMLSADESAQLERFALERSKQEYLLTRALVRTTLSLYSPDVLPPAWAFGKNEFGKPYILHPQEASRLRFNVAHTGGLIALAVGSECDIGIDCENSTRAARCEEVAERFFSENEVELLRQTSDEVLRRQMFIDIWVLKEACIKAVGKGLSMPLDSVSVRFGKDGMQYPSGPLFVTGLGPATAVDLRLFSTGDHSLALCLLDDGKINSMRTVQFFRAAPLLYPHDAFFGVALRASTLGS